MMVKNSGSECSDAAGVPCAFLPTSKLSECTLLTFAIIVFEHYISCGEKKKEGTAVISCPGNKIMDVLAGRREIIISTDWL